jgi:pimeloyl-ACP methyl ester carboxylesterase
MVYPMRFSTTSTRRAVAFFLIAISIAVLPLEAQTRRAAVRSGGGATQRCSGGWSGVVTLRKTLNDSLESDEAGIRKAIDRIKHKTKRDYHYEARAVVDGKDPQNAAVNTKISMTDNDLNWGEERVWESCGNRGDTSRWQIIESVDDRVTQGGAEGPARSFGLMVNEFDGSYSFNIGFNEFEGRYKRVERTTRSGFCQPRNNEPWARDTDQATKIDGAAFSADGKIDPENPDVITGTKTWGYDGTGNVVSFVYTATWTFTRCPQKLLITDLKFQHPDFPDPDNWKEIVDQIGTIDGNRVKIKATVLNMGGEPRYASLVLKETYKGDKWDGGRPDEILPESEMHIRLEPGEEREVEYIWDTDGQAWFDDGRPHEFHRIRAELAEDRKLRDAKMRMLHIAPRPLVLVHGLWSSAQAWIPVYQNLLTSTHSYHWKAYPVGERPEHGKLNTGGSFLSSDKTNTIYENADQLESYTKFAQEDSNAWHVDIVAHSMGGLISRLYIHRQMPIMPDNKPQVKHLVMLGTPNAGSPCADVIDMKFTAFGERVQAVKDLQPANVALFNQHVTNRKGVKFSALAGQTLPVMCKNVEWNDGVVSVSSAIFGIADHAFSNDIHTDLTNTRNFSNFVLPHVVYGPKKTYPLEVRSDTHPLDTFKNIEWGMYSEPFNLFDDADPFGRGHRTYGASARGELDLTAKPTSIELTVGAETVREAEIPIESAAPNLGVTVLANPDVGVSLIDPSGKVRAENLKDSVEARGLFRVLFVGGNIQSGTWRLKIENSSDRERIVLATVWDTGGPVSRPTAKK